jgi:hypothetical protein
MFACIQHLTTLQEAIVPPGQTPRNTGVKLLPFSSADPVEWRQWRNTFTNMSANNRWDAATARTHADAMINGVAKSIVENIPLNNVAISGVAVAPVEQLLLFDAKFITPAAAANSWQMLFSAHQLDEESILLWHSRLYGLYKRAYPTSTQTSTSSRSSSKACRIKASAARPPRTILTRTQQPWTMHNRPARSCTDGTYLRHTVTPGEQYNL